MVTRHGELCEYDSRNGLSRKKGDCSQCKVELIRNFLSHLYLARY